jgi:hypothetical protein
VRATWARRGAGRGEYVAYNRDQSAAPDCGGGQNGAGEHGRWVGQELWRALRGCNVRNMNPEKAEALSPELQRALEPLLAGIEAMSE